MYADKRAMSNMAKAYATEMKRESRQNQVENALRDLVTGLLRMMGLANEGQLETKIKNLAASIIGVKR